MNIFKSIIDFVFPPLCQVCKKPLGKDETIVCSECFGLIIPSSGIKIHPYGLKNIDEVAGFGTFTQPLNEIIHLYKYKGRTGLKDRLADLLYTTFLKHYRNTEINLMVPVPLHRVKKRERGFNQSEILALTLSQKINIPCKNILRRTRYTPSQTMLSRKEREKNIKGAFSCTQNVEGNILLIDDVFTTGSTMDECARVLKQKGAKKVIGLVLAVSD